MLSTYAFKATFRLKKKVFPLKPYRTTEVDFSIIEDNGNNFKTKDWGTLGGCGDARRATELRRILDMD